MEHLVLSGFRTPLEALDALELARQPDMDAWAIARHAARKTSPDWFPPALIRCQIAKDSCRRAALDVLTSPRYEDIRPVALGPELPGRRENMVRAAAGTGTLLRRGGIMIASGHAKTGKSSWAAGLVTEAACTDAGAWGSFCGLEIRGGSSIYVAFEHDADDVRRTALRYAGPSHEDALGRMSAIAADGRRMFGTRYGAFEPTEAFGRLWLAALRARPDYIVVDTYLAASGGESGNNFAYPALNGIRRLAGRCGTAAIVVHHSNKMARRAGGPPGPDARSGGTAFEDVPESAVHLDSPARGAWRLSATHVRHGRIPPPIWMTNAGDGALVFAPGDEPEGLQDE